MKTFHYKLGHKAFHTMTVGELRAKLSEYPDDMPVLATWEGQRMPIEQHFWIEEFHTGAEADRCDCLVIDVDGCQ